MVCLSKLNLLFVLFLEQNIINLRKYAVPSIPLHSVQLFTTVKKKDDNIHKSEAEKSDEQETLTHYAE